jgi:hypothetical protein
MVSPGRRRPHGLRSRAPASDDRPGAPKAGESKRPEHARGVRSSGAGGYFFVELADAFGFAGVLLAFVVLGAAFAVAFAGVFVAALAEVLGPDFDAALAPVVDAVLAAAFAAASALAVFESAARALPAAV